MLKVQQKFDGALLIYWSGLLVLGAAFADSCEPCKAVLSELSKEFSVRDSYLALKKRNEDYLNKPGVSQSALIKVQSNLLLINIKIETSLNKIEALQQDQKKLNGCENCPPTHS